MTVTINGTTGITTPGLSNSGADSAASQTLSGNLTFTSTGNRIIGDFTNATVASRTLFQTSTSNSGTYIGALANGTVADNTGSGFIAWANSDPTASNTAALFAFKNLECRLTSGSNTGTYYPLTFYTGGAERVRIDSSGNVGIGTNSPGYTLDIFGTTNANTRINSTQAGQASYLLLSNSADGYNSYLYRSGTELRLAETTASSGSIVTFFTQNTERMRVGGTGNVGIGTTTPGVKLEVYGQRIRVNTTDSDPGIEIANGVATKGYLFYNTASDVVTLRHASGNGIDAHAGGQLTTPSQPFYQGYASVSTAFSSTWQVLNYSSSQANIGSCYNTSNGRFTAPVSGVYSINAIALVSAASSTTADYRMVIRKNGSEAYITSTTKPVGYATIYANFEWYLSTNDYVEICFYNDSSTGALHPDASFTRLSIRLAG